MFETKRNEVSCIVVYMYSVLHILLHSVQHTDFSSPISSTLKSISA